MKKITTRIGSILGLSLALGCGVPNPEVQQQTSTDVKSPEINDSLKVFEFSLNGTQLRASNDKKHDYKGTMIFWNEDADPKKIAEVMVLAKTSKDEKNAFLKELLPVPGFIKKIALKDERLQQLRLEEQEKKGSYYKDKSAQLSKDSEAWVRSQLAPGK